MTIWVFAVAHVRLCRFIPAQICGGANALSICDRSGKGLTVGPPSAFTFPYNNTWLFNACMKYV